MSHNELIRCIDVYPVTGFLLVTESELPSTERLPSQRGFPLLPLTLVSRESGGECGQKMEEGSPPALNQVAFVSLKRLGIRIPGERQCITDMRMRTQVEGCSHCQTRDDEG